MNYKPSKVSWCRFCKVMPEGELCKQHAPLAKAKPIEMPGKCDFCEGYISDVGSLLKIDSSDLYSCHPCFDSGRSHIYNPKHLSRKKKVVKYYTGKNPFRQKQQARFNAKDEEVLAKGLGCKLTERDPPRRKPGPRKIAGAVSA